MTALVLWCVSTARKESAKEKQLKEEEKILESVAEGRGKILRRRKNKTVNSKLF